MRLGQTCQKRFRHAVGLVRGDSGFGMGHGHSDQAAASPVFHTSAPFQIDGGVLISSHRAINGKKLQFFLQSGQSRLGRDLDVGGGFVGPAGEQRPRHSPDET